MLVELLEISQKLKRISMKFRFIKPENRRGLRIVKKTKNKFVMDKDCFDSWYDFD